MFFGFDLKEILMFPIKDEEARKYLLIGCLVALTSFFIPILPYLVMFGYGMRIAKQVLNNESPRMIAWDDLGGFVKDGLKMFGIRMIFSLPMLIILFPLFLTMIIFPIFISTSNNSDVGIFIPIFILLIFGGIGLLMLISFPLNIIISAAEMHVIEKDDFAAGFRFREWWPIFRANLGGFVAAFGILLMTSFALNFVAQFIYITIVLACLLIVIIPSIVMYSTLIMYVTNAQAYRDGKTKLAQSPIMETAG